MRMILASMLEVPVVTERQFRREGVHVRQRERGTVSIFQPTQAFPPLRGREEKCERRHEHRILPYLDTGMDRALFIRADSGGDGWEERALTGIL